MAMPSSARKTQDGKVGLMGRMKDHARWGVDGHRSRGGPFIADGGVWQKEMCHTPRVSNGIKWKGGRTSG